MRVASITLGVPLHGYGAMRPAPPLPPEPVHLLCPTEAPPALYALPERHTMSVTPDEYVTERDVREGRHALSIPSFFYQMTPKISLNTRCSINISENLSINGRTRSSGQFGICSYNINP